jgi:glutamyl-tRNA synthetase
LFNWLLARSTGGTFVLRIEDTDTERERLGAEPDILRDLAWLGLAWDEGPDVGGPFGPYRQSERSSSYTEKADRLLVTGAAFRCFCPEPGNDSAHAGSHVPVGPSPGHRDPCRSVEVDVAARRAGGGEGFAVRLRVPADDGRGGRSVRFVDRLHGEIAVPFPQIPDAILIRKDGRPTYNFAVVADDVAMRIDLVMRGDDHLSNTPVQVLIYRALAANPPEFAHVPMVLGPDGERLSKRHGATSVGAWRERGVPPEALVNGLALLGWAPSGDRTIVTLDEMVADFSLSRLGRSAAIFDPIKLEWISAQHIRSMSRQRLADEVARALVAAGRIDSAAANALAWVETLAEFLRPALARFDQVDSQVEPVFHAGGPLSEEDRRILDPPEASRVLRVLAERIAVAAGAIAWDDLRREISAETGAKGKTLFQPIRVALTGRGHGRELDHLWPLIDAGARALPGVVPSPSSRVAATLGDPA